MEDYPAQNDFDYEAAFEQDRRMLQKQVLDDLFEVWKVCFLHGPIVTFSSQEDPIDERVGRLASALGVAKEWEDRCEYYLFGDNSI